MGNIGGIAFIMYLAKSVCGSNRDKLNIRNVAVGAVQHDYYTSTLKTFAYMMCLEDE